MNSLSSLPLIIQYIRTVFFNLFFEAEPYAVILVPYGTHGRSQEFLSGVLVKGQNSMPKAESRKGFLGRGSELRSQMHFGCIKSPENAFTGHKCRLVLVSQFDSAEHLDNTNGTSVEKHHIRKTISPHKNTMDVLQICT